MHTQTTIASNMDASAILRAKVSVPSEMLSAQWAATPVWVRERSFFMSSVAKAEIVDGFRAAVSDIVDGKKTVAEARVAIRKLLNKTDYIPLPGQEGTIKDLNTLARQNLVLETNVAQVQGFARWMRQQGALDGFPAQQLVRMRNSEVPRNWHARWIESLDKCGVKEGASGPLEMTALVNHPIWVTLSRFGTPYPPFDFNSGMGILSVKRSGAEELGILPGVNASFAHAAMMTPQDRGLNATLESSPAIRTTDVRESLSETLKGLAEWDKKRLVFTDPNGTRPYTADALAKVISQPLPAAFHDLPGKGQLQADAFIRWSQNHKQFAQRGFTDMWEHFTRLLNRLLPTGRENEEMFRGITFSNNEAFSKFMVGLHRGGYSPRADYPAESWTNALSAARKYLSNGTYRILLRMPGGNSLARDVSPLVRKFETAILKGEVPQGKLAITDSEILLPSEARLAVKKIGAVQETDSGKFVEVFLEERK